MGEAESAIVVRFPVPPAIDRLRRRYDRAARLGVPAHVTILYPFLDPSRLAPAVRATIASIAGEARTARVRFETASCWPGVVYLEPRPSELFLELIRRASAAFPDQPPYGGAFDSIVPHLTIAENPDAPLEEVLAAARAALPFEAVAAGLDVLIERPDGRWRTRWRIPFRG
jgi:2'-5' RNA ligase